MSNGLFFSRFNQSEEGMKPVFRRKSLRGLGWSTCVNPFPRYYRCKGAIFRDSSRNSSRVPRLYIVPLPLWGIVKTVSACFPTNKTNRGYDGGFSPWKRYLNQWLLIRRRWSFLPSRYPPINCDSESSLWNCRWTFAFFMHDLHDFSNLIFENNLRNLNIWHTLLNAYKSLKSFTFFFFYDIYFLYFRLNFSSYLFYPI